MKKLLLIGLIAAGYWTYSTGMLDSWVAQAELENKSLTDITCEDLGRVAKGQSLQNMFGAQFRILELTELRKVSSSASEVTCRAKALMSNGDQSVLTIKISLVNGEKYFEFRTN